MDDGQQVKRGGVTLCTDNFKSDQVKSLRDMLLENFNIITSIHNKKSKSGDYYERIYIKSDSLNENKDKLIPYMHDSMLYKIHAEKIENPDTIKDQDQIQDQPKSLNSRQIQKRWKERHGGD